MIVNTIGLVTVNKGAKVYKQESDDEEEGCDDAYIVQTGQFAAGTGEIRYSQEGQIIVKDNDLISMTESLVWRIRGDIIMRIPGLMTYLYPPKLEDHEVPHDLHPAHVEDSSHEKENNNIITE